jgi:hypothetical protein
MTEQERLLVEQLINNARKMTEEVWKIEMTAMTDRMADAAKITIAERDTEIKMLRERNAELYGQLMRMIDRWEQQRSALEARGLQIVEKGQ